MNKMITWAQQAVERQSAGEYPNYSYVIYSDNVDNCGSWAIKCLAQGGVNVSVSYLLSWTQLPSVLEYSEAKR